MGKNFNFTSAFAVCLALSALPLACGDDEEPSDGKGGSSTGGSAGKGGTGTGGSTGGSAGKGGSGGSTGGTAGKGGTGGSAGKGGTAGTAGTDGGMGGADGGMGGEGGASTMSVCERLCVAGEVASCSNQAACVGSCEDAYLYGGPDCRDEMDALWECAIAGPAGNWSCDTNNQPAYMVDACPDELDAVLAGSCA